ncbi:MAG: hypothetical protein WDN04_11335 [Rhodospirillales bacterium]
MHESAVGDAGFFIPPDGEDMSQCVGPIVRAFVLAGAVGDTSCLAGIRPIRTVPAFATSFADVAPAVAAAGNQVDATGLVLASAVAETVGDAVARYYVSTSGHGAGLRGGTFAISPDQDRLRVDTERFRMDQRSCGQRTNQLEPAFRADPGVGDVCGGRARRNRDDRLNDRQTEAVARLGGMVDGVQLAATRLAP